MHFVASLDAVPQMRQSIGWKTNNPQWSVAG
jgi:hypothetical protein